MRIYVHAFFLEMRVFVQMRANIACVCENRLATGRTDGESQRQMIYNRGVGCFPLFCFLYLFLFLSLFLLPLFLLALFLPSLGHHRPLPPPFIRANVSSAVLSAKLNLIYFWPRGRFVSPYTRDAIDARDVYSSRRYPLTLSSPSIHSSRPFKRLEIDRESR